MIDLLPNNATIVVYLGSLVINLGSDNIPLVVHLIATVAGIILVVSLIYALIPAIPLILTYHSCYIISIRPSSCIILIIFLILNIFTLTAYHIATIRTVILAESPIVALIPAIPLVVSPKIHLISTIASPYKGLVVLPRITAWHLLSNSTIPLVVSLYCGRPCRLFSSKHDQ